MSTNKKILAKGIKYLSGALPLLFIGPVVINSAFKNQENPYYEVVLVVGILFCGIAIFLIFKGVTTIVKGIFDGDK
ncbi:DUF6095 family protein [uncultured Flavobacterium sp.]|uniref:DUF6095 family protein n=1 Tax=uncultured Flavobacterium sp. TaxID=165435 RepID=UPI0030EDADEB|tara:strand:+ start:12684 stop:12911 length:228 start_codon:yes stop_codon:yes gene_type:complete